MSTTEAFFNEVSSSLKAIEHSKKLYNPVLAPDFNSFAYSEFSEGFLAKWLCFYLDPKQTHAQGPKYLKAFIDYCYRNTDIEDKPSLSEEELLYAFVRREESTHDRRRIDIFIRVGEKLTIGIELKIWADDQANQLLDYYNYIKDKGTNPILIYLTPYAKDIEETTFQSGKRLEAIDLNRFQHLTFENDLVSRDLTDDTLLSEWIKISKPDRVRWHLNELNNYLKKHILSESTMETQNEIIKAIQSNDNYAKVAVEVLNSERRIMELAIDKFKSQIVEMCKNLEFLIENPQEGINYNDLKQIWSGFRIEVKGWNNFGFFFENSKANFLGSPYFGIHKKSNTWYDDKEKSELKTDFINELKNVLGHKSKSTGNAPWFYTSRSISLKSILLEDVLLSDNYFKHLKEEFIRIYNAVESNPFLKAQI